LIVRGHTAKQIQAEREDARAGESDCQRRHGRTGLEHRGALLLGVGTRRGRCGQAGNGAAVEMVPLASTMSAKRSRGGVPANGRRGGRVSLWRRARGEQKRGEGCVTYVGRGGGRWRWLWRRPPRRERSGRPMAMAWLRKREEGPAPHWVCALWLRKREKEWRWLGRGSRVVAARVGGMAGFMGPGGPARGMAGFMGPGGPARLG
jgi:hypothetical protein